MDSHSLLQDEKRKKKFQIISRKSLSERAVKKHVRLCRIKEANCSN